MSKTPKPAIRTRRAPLEAGTFDKKARTVEAILATDAWIDGPFGRERLDMTPSSVDLSRAERGLPWHDTHGPHVPGLVGDRVGKVEAIRLKGRALVGTLRASKNPPGEALLIDIEDGIVTHVSIGYRVQKAREAQDGLLITKWQPLEVSTPSVVADPNATIQRTDLMSTEPNTPNPPELDRDGIIAAERQRAADVDAIFVPFVGQDIQALRAQAVAEAWEPDTARARLLAHLGTQASPSARGPDTVTGEDQADKFRTAGTQAVLLRAGYLRDDKEIINASTENPYAGFSLRELARESLRVANVRAPKNPMDLVGLALTRAGIISHSTSDFANVLVDASNKAKQVGWVEAPENVEQWTRPGSIPDFKTTHRPKLSSFSDLDAIPETGEIKYGSFSDFKETIVLAEYGKLFSISRKAIINDDLNAFMDAPAAMARAAKRNMADTVYTILSGNPTMSDGNSLWDASNHSNYVAAGSGAAPSVTTLNAAYASMATQTDAAGNVINVSPRFIIAPHALRGTVDALLQSTLNPAEGSTTAFQEANIWRARLTPIYDARVDADDAAKWYLMADPRAFDTIELATLNGAREPRLERESNITVEGVIMKVAHDWGASALDWRNMYHNDGN